MFLRNFEQLLKHPGIRKIIRLYDTDILASRGTQSDIHRCAITGILLVDDMEPSIILCIAF